MCPRSLYLPYRAALAVALITALTAAPTQAQGLTPGTRVRITAGPERVVGTVATSTADTLTLVRPDGGASAFAWAEVVRVEQSLGRRGHAGKGALIGAGIMGAASVAAFAFDGGNSGGEDWGDVIALVALPANMAVGAGLGALVGLIWRSERWGLLPVGPPSVAHTGGLGFGVVVRP